MPTIKVQDVKYWFSKGTFPLELNSDESLEEVRRIIEEELQRRKELKDLDIKRKSEYTPHEKYLYTIDYSKVYTDLMEELENKMKVSETPVTFQYIWSLCKSLEERYTYRYEKPFNEVYDCPLCSQGSLYVGRYEIGHEFKYGVTCSSCDFEMPGMEDSEYEAIEEFKRFLKDEGYLD